MEIFKKERYIPSPKSHSYERQIWNLVQFSLIFFPNLLSGENKQQRNLPKTHHLKKDKSSYYGLTYLEKFGKLFWIYVALRKRKLQELLINRGAWRAAVHGVTKSWTRLSN